MTLLEALKQFLSSDISETDEKKTEQETKEVKPEGKEVPAKTEEVKVEKTVTKPVEEDKKTPEGETKAEVKEEIMEGSQDMNIFETGWFNSETGKIDESKIKNPEVISAIQQIQAKYQEEKNNRLVSDKLNDELKNYSLAVSEDTLRKVLNLSDVKIGKDGSVTGVKEALEALKTSEPGFFKDKEKESNPLNEGFNPVEKKNTDNITSFAQAFQMMEEIGN